MLQSENGASGAPLWSIDRQMTRQTSLPAPLSSPVLWDSTPIGKPVCLRLCPREQLSPQLILEDKVFRSALRLQHGSTYRSQLHFVGTLIVDDETQRLTYVIDRLQLVDSANDSNHPLFAKQLLGEFLIPIRCDNKNLSTTINTSNSLIQDGIKIIDAYCRSSSPIELHQFSLLYGQMFSRLSPSINADLSFDLLTIKNSFRLTPINHEYVNMLPTALLKNISSPSGNGIYASQPHFGYCGLDRMSRNKILLILENDPQACALPLVGIWVSGVFDVQCAYVWAVCLRYCLNASLKQRLRTGTNDPQQSFLLACYPSTSRGQCDFYEVNSMANTSTSFSLVVDYDLWTCSKKIIMPNPPSHPHDTSGGTQLPYDFEFKHVYDGPKMHALLGAYTGQVSTPIQLVVRSDINLLPSDISFLSAEMPSDEDDEDEVEQQIQQQQHHPATLSSPNTNGSLFGVPRLPPKQTTHQSPSWDSTPASTMTTPKWIAPVPVPPLTIPPQPMRFSSPAPSTIAPSTVANDTQWKEEMLEKMHAYDAHIQALNALVAQLLAGQKQQVNIATPVRESSKCDVAVQSEPPSPATSDDVGESASMVKSNRNSPPSPSPKIEQLQHYQQHTPLLINTRPPCSPAQFQSPPPVRQPEPVIDYASLRKSTDCERIITENIPVPFHQTPMRSTSPLLPTSAPTDLTPVDILKPFFQFMASQQQHKSASSLVTASKSLDTTLMKTIDEESGRQAEKMSQLANVIQQQQKHVTSTTTTGISFTSATLQMQIINQQSSTTTVYPPPATFVPSPHHNQQQQQQQQPQSENDLSLEVRSLAMKYLEDDQLTAAADYDRQSPTPPNTLRQSPQVFDKSMSFATQKYLEKYGIVTSSTRHQQYCMPSDDNDLFTSSSPPQQRMLLPLLPPPPPVFTQPPAPHAPQAKILDLSQIRKLPKLL